jgi:hypothetical protein
MSLFALPVSVSDLTQLQLGIEFFTNTSEAKTEQGQITNPPSTPTVYSYAVQLLANNISNIPNIPLAQVAMAVDSLMFGVTDNTTELTKLATQFLPPQAANAVANGLNPTVYAAEALGLGLAEGNGTSTAFATDFGSLSIPRFASEVASLTGIDSGAIQVFVNNWINFYTANPPAGVSVRLAAYGAAFGDAVGAALLNPTVNGSLALLVSEVQNALIDNAEGRYQAGIALIAEPPHLALQGEALLIPGAGGAPFGPTIDWAQFGALGPGNYAQFVVSAQIADLTIKNAPSTFTLNTNNFGTKSVNIDAAGFHENLFTLILGDSTASESLHGAVGVSGYSTVEIVVAKGPGTDSITNGIGAADNLIISGSGSLSLGGEVFAGTITDNGVSLTMGFTTAGKIDASNAPVLVMNEPAIQGPTVGAVTVLGGTGPGNILQGSVDVNSSSTVTFSNGSTGVSFGAGADNIRGGSGGHDLIFGDGGPDTITLPNHSLFDLVVFGEEKENTTTTVLAMTDGMDLAYPGSWGAGATATAIPNLFTGNTGGTSTDMTVITGFQAGSGDVLGFTVAAWNGGSTSGFVAVAKGDLVVLNGFLVVQPGAAQLSAVWVNSTSNSSLKASDNVLLYDPSDASVQNAEQLAAQLHAASDAIVLPGGGFIASGQDWHVLVAYDASFNLLGSIHHVVNIADVDLVNTSASSQSSTANLHVYASDMVSLTGVSLTSLTAANIFFI